MPYTVVSVTRETCPSNYAADRRARGPGTPGHAPVLRRRRRRGARLRPDGVDALQDQIPAFTGLTPWRTQVGSALVRDPDNQGVIGVTTTLLCTIST
jgi:hypothetical protein